VYQDTKFLNTNESTEVEDIEDILDVDLTGDEVQENLVEGQIIAINIKNSKSCVACNSLINNETENETITCSNCKVTTLKETVNTKLVCQIVIKTVHDKLLNYTCFNDAIQSLLNTINNTIEIESIDIEKLQIFC